MTARRITEARPVVPAVAGVTFCIDQSTRADAVTTRIAHAFPDRPDGSLSQVALCGVVCPLRQDVAVSRRRGYSFTLCQVCEGRVGT